MISLIVSIAIAVAGVIAALWLLIKGARGSSRVLGIIGTALILLGVISRFAYQWTVERYLGQVDDAAAVGVLTVVTAVGGVLTGAGLILLARAIIAADY